MNLKFHAVKTEKLYILNIEIVTILLFDFLKSSLRLCIHIKLLKGMNYSSFPFHTQYVYNTIHHLKEVVWNRQNRSLFHRQCPIIILQKEKNDQQ